MEITKTLPLPAAPTAVTEFIRAVCEHHGVWPDAKVTATEKELIIKFRTRDAVQ